MKAGTASPSPAASAKTGRARAEEVSLVTDQSALDALLPEWTALFHAAQCPNPFAHPDWLSTWARHFVASDELYMVTVRDGEGLLAVAPFYRRSHRLAGRTALTRLGLLGTGRSAALTELPQILVRSGEERRALRAIMGFLGSREAEWDFVELSLAPEHGWFEPEWLPHGAEAPASVIPGGAMACVVLPLPPAGSELFPSLKRNVKESVRRGRNRLARSERDWRVTSIGEDSPALEQALGQLARLHHARSQMPGRIQHPDYLAPAATRAFLDDVAGPMARAGSLAVWLLEVEEEPIAGLLVLRANGAIFVSSSGVDPEWWDFNPLTVLLAEVFQEAIHRGDGLVNLSIGPTVAKLRWSEELQIHHQFAVVGPRPRSHRAYSVYRHRQVAAELRRERQRHKQG